MLQLTQNLKTGKMEITEVPIPSIDDNSVLIKNYNSLISAGTEGSMVSVARKGYIGKAKEKPEQVKAIAADWKKSKKVPKEMMASVLNNLLSKCNVEALILSREINLPPPVQLPKVNVKK